MLLHRRRVGRGRHVTSVWVDRTIGAVLFALLTVGFAALVWAVATALDLPITHGRLL